MPYDKQQAVDSGTEQSDRSGSAGDVETDTDPVDPRFLAIDETEVDKLREIVAQKIEDHRSRNAWKEIGEELTTQSEYIGSEYIRSESIGSEYQYKIIIEASTIEELQELQAELGIDEKAIRARQADAGIGRLYSSRRKEYVKQVLVEQIESRAAARIDEDRIRCEANEMIAEFFNRTGGTVAFGWTQSPYGSFSTCQSNKEEPDLVATFQHATAELSELPLPGHTADVVVLEDGARVDVESSFGSRSFSLERGAYKIRPRSVRALAQDAGLIDVEKRPGSCIVRDNGTLDIDVIEAENTARVVEPQSGSGGYSKWYTGSWTKYRDFDPEREMVLITTGEKSYDGNSLGRRQERTWLVGRDEGQVWSHQVYNTHDTIDEALAFMKPAEVKRFEAKGRQVVRQGDVYFIEMCRHSNFDALDGTRHTVVQRSDERVVVEHPEHADLELLGEWKAILNNDGS